MKKAFLFIVSIICVAFLAGCGTIANESAESTKDAEISEPVETEEIKYDFRYANYGEDAETIKAREPLTISEETDEGLFVGEGAEYAGFQTSILYKIDKNVGFYEGDYWINNPHDAADMYIGDFARLKESITAVYGDPISDKVDMIDSLGEYSDPGTALKLGYSYYEAIWETEDTKITLFMVGEFGIVNTMACYESKDIKPAPNTDGV